MTTPARPYVRPWALATPIAVFLFCLPLLRPLHHPGQASVDEELRLATIAATVENSQSNTASAAPAGDSSFSASMAIDPDLVSTHMHLIRVNGRLYSDQPPTLAFLLSGPYWLLYRMGYRMTTNSVLVPYLLTLLGVTIPAAAVAGMAYRMGRLFELRRPLRAALAAATVFATGLISYAVVLNAHVPAAALVMACAFCLVHLAASKSPARGGGWLVLAGFCAALATSIDLWAGLLLVLFPIAILAMRLHPALRVGGVILFALGTIPPLQFHAVLTVPLTGDVLSGSFHPELAAYRPGRFPDESQVANDAPPDTDIPVSSDPADEDETAAAPTLSQSVMHGLSQFAWALLGEHGLLVHFPVVVLGVAGMFAVMHRHWPTTTKVLAADSAVAVVIALGVLAWRSHGWAMGSDADFANRRLILFLPILLLWAGAWLRRSHHALTWTLAAILLVFSLTVSLIGATDPMPPGGYARYTAVSAWHNLLHPPTTAPAALVSER